MKRLILNIFFVSVSITVVGQQQLSTKSKKAIELYTLADNFRVRGQFQQAVDLLKQALDKDEDFVEAYYRLGLVYFNAKQYPLAIQTFEDGVKRTTDVRKQKIFWFDMGEAYHLKGDYEKAIAVLTLFVNNETQNKPRIDYATTLLRSAEFAAQNKNKRTAYNQRTLSDTVNRFLMQYFPVLTADEQQLIFTRRVGNDPNDDEDIVVSLKGENGQWLEPVSISKNITSKLNEGTCTISADGRKLIFTSCSGRDGIGSCDLYESKKVGADWSTPKNLGTNVNSLAWESQPALSADGRTLYFVSDRRNGLGRRDIWYSTQDEKGNWTKAVNIGKPINSAYDEISPFIHANNQTLFFASNGLPGFGGYDIFFSEKDSTTWTNPKNLGAPINTNEDQFSLFITADGKRGYYAHEETMPNGQSPSKIVEFSIPAENQIRNRSNYVKGIVSDAKTNQPLSASIELIDLSRNTTTALVQSDSITGEYLMVLTQGADYALYINKKGYLFKSMNFNYSDINDFDPIVVDVKLSKALAGSSAVLNNIFFDVDKYELKPLSYPELNKVVRFLNENVTLKVEIGGHTDSTGSALYNQQLSEKRATAVYHYLMSKGIGQNRLIAKGYGSAEPISSNETEAGRLLNRRIEFKIVR